MVPRSDVWKSQLCEPLTETARGRAAEIPKVDVSSERESEDPSPQRTEWQKIEIDIHADLKKAEA